MSSIVFCHPPGHILHMSGMKLAAQRLPEPPVQVTYTCLHGALPSPGRQAMRCSHGFTQRLMGPAGSIGWAVRYGQGYTQGLLGASSHGCLFPPICSFRTEAALTGYSRADGDRVGFPRHQGDLFHLECVSYCTKTRNCLMVKQGKE